MLQVVVPPAVGAGLQKPLRVAEVLQYGQAVAALAQAARTLQVVQVVAQHPRTAPCPIQQAPA